MIKTIGRILMLLAKKRKINRKSKKEREEKEREKGRVIFAPSHNAFFHVVQVVTLSP